MPKGKIKAIIFDIGRVIIRLNLHRVQAGLAEGMTLRPEELWSAIEKDPRWKDWQEGRMSARDWHNNLTSRLGIPLKFEQFSTVWNSILEPKTLIEESLFEALSEKYCLALLSNTDKIHVDYIEANFAFLKYFPPERRIYSCTVGVCKPDPLIYRQALRACKAKAEEAIYIDDIEANVEAARKLGMEGIHFESAEQLQQELRMRGVEIPVTRTK